MEPSAESQGLSKLLAKFIEDSDTKDSIAEAVKFFVLQLKEEAKRHNAEHENCGGDCVGSHVMKILRAAQNMKDPMYEEMDMAMRLQIKQGVTSAIYMVK